MWSFSSSSSSAKTNGPVNATPNTGKFISVKWISSKSDSTSRNLQVHPITTCLSTVLSNNINIISIFGRARQGKSFLMNCLAGEREIFTISNKKESCTQGIDISSKWLSLEEFSKIDNDTSIKASPNIRVGFVDAEGQGDKDVEYDAELVCPILLASKSVIFNWKGDLQKDSLLQTLGIMCRAAKNVGDESSRSDIGSSTSRAPFGHLHIVFRDWQAVDSTETDVLHDLLQAEGTSSGRSRDLIRTELRACFASIRVWLFDSPVSNSEFLKNKLTIEMCTARFRSQVRALRSALSQQLRTGTMFSASTSAMLMGKDLQPFIKTIAASLASGSPVLPQSAFANMLKEDVAHHLKRTTTMISQFGADLYTDTHSKSISVIAAARKLGIERAMSMESSAIATIPVSSRGLTSKSLTLAMQKAGIIEYAPSSTSAYAAYEKTVIPTHEQALAALREFIDVQMMEMVSKLEIMFNIDMSSSAISSSGDPFIKLATRALLDAKAAAVQCETLFTAQLTASYGAFFTAAEKAIITAVNEKHTQLIASLNSSGDSNAVPRSKLRQLLDAAAKKQATSPDEALSHIKRSHDIIFFNLINFILLYPSFRHSEFHRLALNDTVNKVLEKSTNCLDDTIEKTMTAFAATKKKLASTITASQKQDLVDRAIVHMRRHCDDTLAKLIAQNTVPSVPVKTNKPIGAGKATQSTIPALCRGFGRKTMEAMLDQQWYVKDNENKATLTSLGADAATIEAVSKSFTGACKELGETIHRNYNNLMERNVAFAVTQGTKRMEKSLLSSLPPACCEPSELENYRLELGEAINKIYLSAFEEILESLGGWSLGEAEQDVIKEGLSSVCSASMTSLIEAAERECQETQKILALERNKKRLSEPSDTDMKKKRKEESVPEKNLSDQASTRGAPQPLPHQPLVPKLFQTDKKIASSGGQKNGIAEDWDAIISPAEQRLRARAFAETLKSPKAGQSKSEKPTGKAKQGKFGTPELKDDDEMEVEAEAPSRQQAPSATGKGVANDKRKVLEDERAKAKAWAAENLPKKKK